jgi:predicted HAD superfamily phosphohydrolase
MNYENRRYLIIPTNITGSINYDEVYETSNETLRLSVDGTKTFVKYDLPNRPSIYSTDYVEYTHHQILEVLGGEEWVVEENIE